MADLLVKVREVYWNLGLAMPFEGIANFSSPMSSRRSMAL
jgi:hypothetical protein